MKTYFAAILFGVFSAAIWLGAAATLNGCNQESSGGPGAARTPSQKAIVGQADETFSLDVPMLSTNLNQGETATVSIGIKRGTNMDGDVALMFAGLPEGVTIEPATPSIKREDTETKFTLRAADNASLGDFTVKVMGHTMKGGDASNNLKLTVAKQEPTEAANAATETAKATAETVVAAAEGAKAERDEYARETQKLLEELDAKYEELVARAADTEGEAKKDLDLKLAQAKEKRDVAAARLDELQEASADRWEKIKEGADNAFDDLKSMFE